MAARRCRRHGRRARRVLAVCLALLVAACSDNDGTPIDLQVRDVTLHGPLHVDSANGRYFTDARGRAVYLTGSHTWLNFQDGGLSDPPPPFDYPAYLTFLSRHGYNFFRLWRWEQSKWTTEIDSDFWYSPPPYARTGPGVALDGKPRFDLSHLDSRYFERMRERIRLAGERGIYVSVMLFNGWSLQREGPVTGRNPWDGHPYNARNNINGVDGDPEHSGGGARTHTLHDPRITALQEQYVRAVIDAVNDLDNVLYEISNESQVGSEAWEYYMIDFVHRYEATKPKQHPVGMTAQWPDGGNDVIYASPADWVSPNGGLYDPPVAGGAKVILDDTDHLCGICGDVIWVWRSFLRGRNPVLMDPYDGTPGNGSPPGFRIDDPYWVTLRRNFAYTAYFARRIHLDAMRPMREIASTHDCLANPAPTGAEYLILVPRPNGRIAHYVRKNSVTVDLSATRGKLAVEWLRLGTGRLLSRDSVPAEGQRTFTSPWRDDAVLYLH